jgi:hypothetical protein
MTYRIAGLAPELFAPLFVLDDAALAKRRARRVIADTDRGFPCRVSLEDARAGEELLLIHHTHHAVETPYRSAFAIYVCRQASAAGLWRGCPPPVFAGRILSLRAFTAAGDMVRAQLAGDGEADRAIRVLLEDGEVAYIDAHNAAAGCFAARVERDER